MHRKFFVYLPGVEGSMAGEWEQCLRQIVETRSSGLRPLKLNIYVDQPDFLSFLDLRNIITGSVRETFRNDCPAFNITVHPPEEPWKIAVEAQFLIPDKNPVITRFNNNIPYVVIESEPVKQVWGAGLMSEHYQHDTRKAASEAFDQMVHILENEGMSLNNLVRQWNYIGNILEVNEDFQNYQVFNEVRSEYYQKYRTVKGYPAATGVGMKMGGVILDFCAIKSDGTVAVKAVDNPNQVNAYQYGQQVLKGLTGKGKTQKHPPQFERALLVQGNPCSTLFVSGTASIIGQETIGKEDVVKQTLVTIENIKKLAEPEHISKLLEQSTLCTGKYSLMRVYIKRKEDFLNVKSICLEHFPDTPAIYIMADICRDDLLIEIEAELMFNL